MWEMGINPICKGTKINNVIVRPTPFSRHVPLFLSASQHHLPQKPQLPPYLPLHYPKLELIAQIAKGSAPISHHPNMGLEEVGVTDLEKGLMTSPTSQSTLTEPPSPSPSPSPSSATAPALVLSNSGKRIDQAGKKKYVKQVTGRHNDTDLHLAAKRGDLAAVRQILDDIDSQMVGTLSGADFDVEVADIRASVVNEVNELGETALYTAAEKGHLDVVKELLKYSITETISKKNRLGFDPLHIAAREGHHAIVQVLLDHDPGLSKTIGPSNATPLITAATRGHTAVIVNELLQLPDSNVNAPNRDHKTALDIAEGLPLSEESSEIKNCLLRYGAVRANELNQPRDELRKTVSQIKKDVHIQLEQTKKTNTRVYGIAKDLRKLHREGINNATNSVTVVAVLFATVAFAAIFTVPGGDHDDGKAVVVSRASFKIFFIFNAIALFTSLAVVVVQITLVRGETKAERRVVEVINKLMWLASVCTSVAFMASSYIVVGRSHEWAAVLVTVVGGVIMAGVLGTMTYYVVKSKRIRSMRKKEKHARSGSNSWHQTEFSNSEVDRIYAL
ncbi:hypothetical protein RJ639_043639 [Escallonia herrerae]|uniref:PGG domain-containing protein n=1 Tax=Escallonia herrerae TaxID=1293975 RepID=A0AA88WB02_9ASTE|nr:hypothetical protein RJ639_043639 [Escallonia herrerae]